MYKIQLTLTPSDESSTQVVSTLNSNRGCIPKWLVIIPEDDIINCINYSQFGVSGAYGILIEYIMKQVLLAITTTLGHNIPFKANKYNWPYILWVEPTLHRRYRNNSLRIKFIRSLHIASINQDRMVVLPLKQNWDENEFNYISANGSLSQIGLEKFCLAIDSTIRYADTKVMRNHGLRLPQIFLKDKLQDEMEKRMSTFERNQGPQNRQNMMQQQLSQASSSPTRSRTSKQAEPSHTYV